MDANESNKEKEWLLLIADGDEQAFRFFFEKYTSILLPYVTRFVNAAAIAEELVQEVFIKVWLHRDQLPQIENLKAWIFRIAANECYVFLRRKELERKTQKLLRQNDAVVDWQNDVIIDSQVSTYKELRQAIEEAVHMLPEKRRQIYRLSRVEGLKPSEIAERLDLSVSTVKNTLGTALEFIREYLLRKELLTWGCVILINCSR